MTTYGNIIVLVTGSTDGIGKKIALELSRRGAIVLLHGRDGDKLEVTAKEIYKATGNSNLDLFIADFASQEQIRDMAQVISKKFDHINVLINNAGLVAKTFQKSDDGIELTIAVNHLAPFLLTHLLLDNIKMSSYARIVNVTSEAHRYAKFSLSNFQCKKEFDIWNAYCCSKLLNLFFTFELAKRLKRTHITVNAVHPAVVDSKMLRQLGYDGIDSMEEAATTLLYLIFSPKLEKISGKYFYKSHKEKGSPKPTKSSSISRKSKIRKQVWVISEELTGIDCN